MVQGSLWGKTKEDLEETSGWEQRYRWVEADEFRHANEIPAIHLETSLTLILLHNTGGTAPKSCVRARNVFQNFIKHK